MLPKERSLSRRQRRPSTSEDSSWLLIASQRRVSLPMLTNQSFTCRRIILEHDRVNRLCERTARQLVQGMSPRAQQRGLRCLFWRSMHICLSAPSQCAIQQPAD